ncbi:MAG: hypothetical protein MI867_19440 [Pseudomonadales bacterium]|nr:hypothetical protein [Pseudomonadales bacterium]
MSALHLLGAALLVWLARDLVAGDVYLHRAFYRSFEPAAYWAVILLWFIVAISCFHDLVL